MWADERLKVKHVVYFIFETSNIKSFRKTKGFFLAIIHSVVYINKRENFIHFKMLLYKARWAGMTSKEEYTSITQ